MSKFPPTKELLFKYEVLCARLDIRNFFLKYAVQEVYENIGQVLSLVKMQLGVLEITGNINSDESTSSPASLLGQSIRDLRAMSKSFYPDTAVVKEEGLIEALQTVISVLWPDSKDVVTVTVKGIKKEIQPEIILIIFKMIKEILTSIKEFRSAPVGIVMTYGDEDVKFIISYTGKEISSIWESAGSATDGDLTLEQRAKLIKGRLRMAKSKSGTNRLILQSPFKIASHE